MKRDVKQNFHSAATEAADSFEPAPAPERVKIFTVDRFRPAADRLLLKRLPAPEEGLIVKPQIATEQSEYGYVLAVGAGVDVPLDSVAKFSKFSAEEIHFEDEEDGEEYVISFRHDIRGWFGPAVPKPSPFRGVLAGVDLAGD